MEKHKLPSNFCESMVFTLLMSMFMASIMFLYNHAIHSGGLTWETFKAFNYQFFIFWGIAYVLALFVAHPLAEKITFKVVNPKKDSKIIISLVMSTMMVGLMVSFMSIVGVVINAINFNSFSVEIILEYFSSVFKGFIFALPLNILIVGPLVREIFSFIYKKKYLKVQNNIVSITKQEELKPKKDQNVPEDKVIENK